MKTYAKRVMTMAAAGLAMGAVSGCDLVGNPVDLLQGNVKTPDEFEVVARKPLRMPQSVRVDDLPVPRPGARSPLEPNPNEDAARALLGTTAGGGTGATSTSENALLSAANAAAADPNIGETLKEDEKRAEANKPYEPPSIFTLLGGNVEEPPEDALDADAESQRLQSQGIAPAPTNPNPPAVEDGS